MTKTVTTRYDVAEHLRTPEEMAAYLEACLEEADGDAAFIAKALGDIARAKGMSQVARDAGISRESLYKALSGERVPGFDTILKVTKALGLRLHAEAAVTSQAIYTDRIRQEVAQTPDEYLPLLLEMIHLFRQSIVLKPAEESFRQGWQEALRSETLPIGELWTGIEA